MAVEPPGVVAAAEADGRFKPLLGMDEGAPPEAAGALWAASGGTPKRTKATLAMSEERTR